MSERYTAKELVAEYDKAVENNSLEKPIGLVKEATKAAFMSMMYGYKLEDSDLDLYLSIIPPYSQVYIALKRIKNRRKIRAEKERINIGR